VTIVARDLTALVNTTLVQNLNPPPDPALAQVEWIKPGRSVWQWHPGDRDGDAALLAPGRD
jgi:alpha-glucosidase